DAQVVFRLGEFELTKEDIRHVVVVVLAGVNKRLANVGVPTELPREGGSFDELRASAEDREDVHVWCLTGGAMPSCSRRSIRVRRPGDRASIPRISARSRLVAGARFAVWLSIRGARRP